MTNKQQAMTNNNVVYELPHFLVGIKCMTYNHHDYIVDAMNGFTMQQTTFPFVAVIVDDASTDGEPEVIDKYLKEHFDLSSTSDAKLWENDEARYVFAHHKQNPNCYFGVVFLKTNYYSQKKSKNPHIDKWLNEVKYIALCEGDDYWTDSQKIQMQVDFMESHPDYSMTCCKTKRFSQIRKEFDSDVLCNAKDGDLNPKDIIEKGGLYIATCSILFDKNVINNYPEYCKKCHVGDYPLQIMCAIKGKVWYFNKSMAVYRIEHPGSWCQKQIEERISVERLKGNYSEVIMLKGYSNDFPQYSDYFYKRVLVYLYSFMPSKEFDPVGYDNFMIIFSKVIKELSLKDRVLLLLKASKYSYFWYMYISVGTKTKKWLQLTTT